MLKKYTTIKHIEAEPMTRKQAEEKGLTRGVEPEGVADEDGYRVVYADGYESWSPAKNFEEAATKASASRIKPETHDLLNSLASELESNGGKISEDFVNGYAEACTYEYGKVGDSARVCVLTTTTGNKIVGKALVLDVNNDVEEKGNSVARKNCQEELWSFLGGMAKNLEKI